MMVPCTVQPLKDFIASDYMRKKKIGIRATCVLPSLQASHLRRDLQLLWSRAAPSTCREQFWILFRIGCACLVTSVY